MIPPVCIFLAQFLVFVKGYCKLLIYNGLNMTIDFLNYDDLKLSFKKTLTMPATHIMIGSRCRDWPDTQTERISKWKISNF